MTYVRPKGTKTKGIRWQIVDIKNPHQRFKTLEVRTRKEANAYLHKYLGDKADNRPNSLFLEKVNFKEYAETKYLPYSKTFKRERSYKEEVKIVHQLVIKFGDHLLNQITSEVIGVYQRECLNRGLAKKTTNNIISVLNCILKLAYEQRIILHVPKIKLLKLDKLAPRCYSDDELRKILGKSKELESKTLYDFLVIFLNTGLRRSELQSLKWEDVDLVAKQLIVNRSKTHEFRVIPLNSELQSHFEYLKAKTRLGQIHLFEKSDGTPLSVHGYYKRLIYFLKKNNLKRPGVAIHALRHTFGGSLAKKGVSAFLTAQVMGHKQINTTLRYTQMYPIDLRSAVETISHDLPTTLDEKIIRIA